jgi:hypothetical protein
MATPPSGACAAAGMISGLEGDELASGGRSDGHPTGALVVSVVDSYTLAR